VGHSGGIARPVPVGDSDLQAALCNLSVTEISGSVATHVRCSLAPHQDASGRIVGNSQAMVVGVIADFDSWEFLLCTRTGRWSSEDSLATTAPSRPPPWLLSGRHVGIGVFPEGEEISVGGQCADAGCIWGRLTTVAHKPSIVIEVVTTFSSFQVP
jgi:hypothetical protein